MNFIKKNYEKILLGAVLLGLFVAVLSLPVVIKADKDAQSAIIGRVVDTQPKPLPPLDMSGFNNTLNRVQSSYGVDFEITNRLFNPMKWQKTPSGGVIEIENANMVGVGAIKIAGIKPLYFILTLKDIEPATQFSPARYVISMQQENAPVPGQRNPRDTYLSVGEKNKVLSLVSASGTPENPQLVLQMVDSGETIKLSKSQSFQRVDGFMADLSYTDPTNPSQPKKWNNTRVGDTLKNIDNDDYIVVVIDKNEVVLSAQSNQKRTTVTYQP